MDGGFARSALSQSKANVDTWRRVSDSKAAAVRARSVLMCRRVCHVANELCTCTMECR